MDSKELRLLGEAYAGIQEGYGKKEEKEEDCVPKSEKGEHNCAKKVCHEQFGQGTCIFGEHAEPDENGFVSHYDVMFEHGVERAVPTSEMEILVSESHGGHGGKKKTMVAHYEAEGEQLDENPVVDALRSGLKKIGVSGTSSALERENRANANQRRLGQEAMRRAGVGPSERPTGLNNSADLFDIVKGHLMSEGYADTNEKALVIMANMSEEWKESIIEAEVLAMKNGVPGSVKVKPALSIPGTSIGVGPNRPVKGTFTTTTPEQRAKIKQGDTHIDRGVGGNQPRQGAGPTSNERRRYNAELSRQNKPNAPRMPL